MAALQIVDITKVFPREILAEFATTLGIRPPDTGRPAASASPTSGYQLSNLEARRLAATFAGLGSTRRFAANAAQAAAGLTDGMHQVGVFLQRMAEKNPALAARALKHVVEVAEKHAKVGPGGQYV